MCGIYGMVGTGALASILVGGLKRLEYRGYDSAGLALAGPHGLTRLRAAGKVAALEQLVRHQDPQGSAGIAHTRWATHGAASEANAHPHQAGSVAIVHNGIIENHQDLRAELSAHGAIFTSETDSEVIPWLIHFGLADGLDLETAILMAAQRLTGAYAIAIIDAHHPDRLVAIRRGSPLIIGLGLGCMLLSSDQQALAPHADRMLTLADGDMAVLTADTLRITDDSGRPVTRPVLALMADMEETELGQHPHHMHREIHQQPAATGHVLDLHADDDDLIARLPFDLARLDRLTLIACGTSYHAALIARHWFETLADLPVEVDIASEYRHRLIPRFAREGAILISQSGETADTLACIPMLHAAGVPTLALVNRPLASMSRLASGWLDLGAGPEIGVASTKAFTAQLTLLARLAVLAGRQRRSGNREWRFCLAELARLPALLSETLDQVQPACHLAAGLLAPSASALFIGRGPLAPLALEGALKLKEISYIHAEGYAAGELKHGPIALIADGLPVVALAFSGPLLDKMASNIAEVAARGARVIVIGDAAACARLAPLASLCVPIPDAPELLHPILAAIPLQWIAYHTALVRGADVDRPRNLAKSVTVE